MAKIPNPQTQEEAILLTSETLTFYKHQSQKHRQKMVKLFKGYNNYLDTVNSGQQTPFVVNLSAQMVEKGLPRIYAKNPTWIATKNTSSFNIKAFSKAIGEVEEALKLGDDPELEEQLKELKLKQAEFEQSMVEGIQSYLSYIFDQYDYKETLQLWAKSALLYGYSFIKTDYKYELATEFDSNGNIKEKPAGEYPSIEVKSWSDMYVDARFQSLKEMPSIIEKITGISLTQLKREDKYFNLDKIADITALGDISDDDYKEQIKAILGINIPDGTNITRLNKNDLDLTVFYGLFKGEGDKDEALHKITIANDVVVVGMEKILRYPFVAFKCFSNPEQFYGTGLSEKVQPYQDELTFKKQAFADSVNQALYRSFFYDDGLGAPPSSMRPKPGGMTKVKSVARLDEHFRELESKPLPSEYFSEQNDLERQAENAAFQINASSPQTQSALTDTLGGVRLQAEESNGVYKMIRDNFTSAMTDLGYLLILETRDNFKSNIAIRSTNSGEFWELNKEMLRDPEIRYALSIEANSSSFEDLGKKRENAIALGNYMTQLFQLQLVPKEAVLETTKMILGTYERVNPNTFLGLEQEQPQQPQQAPQEAGAIEPPPQEVDENKAEVDETIKSEVNFQE